MPDCVVIGTDLGRSARLSPDLSAYSEAFPLYRDRKPEVENAQAYAENRGCELRQE